VSIEQAKESYIEALAEHDGHVEADIVELSCPWCNGIEVDWDDFEEDDD